MCRRRAGNAKADERHKVDWLKSMGLADALCQQQMEGGVGVARKLWGYGVRVQRSSMNVDGAGQMYRVAGVPVELSASGVARVLRARGKTARPVRRLRIERGALAWLVQATSAPPRATGLVGASLIVVGADTGPPPRRQAVGIT